jgi:DNA-binding MarR family transcriptional regulator
MGSGSMTVRHSDKLERGGQGWPDLSRPLPREPRLNISWLFDIPARAVERALLRALAEHGFSDLRPAHGKVFETVRGEGSRLTDMAERALLTKQSMQYLVDDLERLGYLERIPDPGDRRAKLVRLTPRGRETVLVGRQAIAALEQRWIARLGETKMERLRRLLEELAEEAADEAAFGPQD